MTFRFLCFILSLRFIFFPSLDHSFLASFSLTFIYFSSFSIFVPSLQFICFFLSFYRYLIFILLIFVFHYFFTLSMFFPFPRFFIVSSFLYSLLICSFCRVFCSLSSSLSLCLFRSVFTLYLFVSPYRYDELFSFRSQLRSGSQSSGTRTVSHSGSELE
jgi:hypothetical protein